MAGGSSEQVQVYLRATRTLVRDQPDFCCNLRTDWEGTIICVTAWHDDRVLQRLAFMLHARAIEMYERHAPPPYCA